MWTEQAPSEPLSRFAAWSVFFVVSYRYGRTPFRAHTPRNGTLTAPLPSQNDTKEHKNRCLRHSCVAGQQVHQRVRAAKPQSHIDEGKRRSCRCCHVWDSGGGHMDERRVQMAAETNKETGVLLGRGQQSHRGDPRNHRRREEGAQLDSRRTQAVF